MEKACKLGALRPNDLRFLLFDRGLQQKKIVAADNRKRPDI